MDDRYKWFYTFCLLIITVGWAIFTVLIVKGAIDHPTDIGIVQASGTSVLLGALISWNGAVNNYWFRKRPPTNDQK